MKKDGIIRLETAEDYREAENLTREAFWNVYRPGCLEHYVLHSFRGRPDFVPELDFVLERDGKLIGHVMYARSEIRTDGGGTVSSMTFGPISIAPSEQHKGYGTALLRHSMEVAGRLGAGALAITGNIHFYGKSGFVVAGTKGIHYYHSLYSGDAAPQSAYCRHTFHIVQQCRQGSDKGLVLFCRSIGRVLNRPPLRIFWLGTAPPAGGR